MTAVLRAQGLGKSYAALSVEDHLRLGARLNPGWDDALARRAPGVTVGMLVRRTVLAMAITLAVFIAVQIAMPLLVRPHLIQPTRATIEITASSLDNLGMPPGNAPVRAQLKAPDAGACTGAWVLSSQTVDASGHAVASIPLSRSGACAPSQGRPAKQPAAAGPGAELSACFAEMKRLGYRQRVTYQPAGRFWAFQWYETGIFTALALGLAGFCFWRLRHRLS